MDKPTPAPEVSSQAQQAFIDYLERIDRGEQLSPEEFLKQHPAVAPELQSLLMASDRLAGMAASLAGDTTPKEANPTVAPAVDPAKLSGPVGAVALPAMMGRYRIEKELGRGAMGAVYRAHDIELDRPVALKIPHFSSNDNPELISRFLREARSAAVLAHPNICRVYDVSDYQGTRYIAMEYIDGKPLTAFIGNVQPKQAASVIRKLALGLAEAHKQGIIHRDLKPDNILINSKGEPVLTDFGLARETTKGSSKATQDGVILGSPAYMPPEQAAGNLSEMGPASDVYSLGVVLYQMLVGDVPFRGSVVEVLASVLMKTPKTVREAKPDVDPALAAICDKMMSKKAADRYQSMTEVASAVNDWLKTAANLQSTATIAPTKQDALAGEMKIAEPQAKSKLGSTHTITPKSTLSGTANPQATIPPGKKAPERTPQQLKDLAELVDQLLVRNDYLEAIRIVEEIPEYQRTPELRKLLGEGYQVKSTIEKLERQLEKHLNLVDIPALKKCVDQLLKLRPSHPRGKEIRKALNTEGKRGVLRIRKESGQFDAVGSVWEPWKLAAGVGSLLVMGVIAYFAVTIYINGTMQDVAIEIDDPTAVVKIDGQTVDITGAGTGQIKLTLGNHAYTVERDNVTVKTAQSFQVTKDGKNVVTITLRDPKPGDGVAGTPPGPTETSPLKMWSWSFNRINGEVFPEKSNGQFALRLAKSSTTSQAKSLIQGNLIHLNGQDSLEANGVGDFGVQDAFSLAIWARPQTSHHGALIAKFSDQSAASGYAIEFNQGGFGATFISDWGGGLKAIEKFTETKFPENQWYHVVMTYDGSKQAAGVKIYVNGEESSHETRRDELNGDIRNEQPLRIGGRNAAQYFAGSLVEPRLYAKALAPAEVKRELEQMPKPDVNVPLINVETSPTGTTPPLAVAPFDAAQAKAHQEAWAKHLGVPVEYTNSIGMKFRLIPPGEFLMGSTAEEMEAALNVVGEDKHFEKCIKSEAPQHKVRLTQAFYLGVNEVTQAEYEQVMGTNPSHFSPTGAGKASIAGLETSKHPVENVSVHDAAEFCVKLSQMCKLKPFYRRAGDAITTLDGTGYRLPTEAEWEFACQAGAAANQNEEFSRIGWIATDSSGRTHAVGELKANPLGFSDLQGNVWEWVEDAWEPSSYKPFAEKTATNPSTPFSAGSLHVLRGGGWDDTPSRCRSSHRFALIPSHRVASLGFRVALPVEAVNKSLAIAPIPATPPLAVAPFDAAQAKAHQESWAKHLGVPVEYTNSIGMKFRLIPPGEFLMGIPAGDFDTLNAERNKHGAGLERFEQLLKSEVPQHKVRLTKPIYVGVHEVTQEGFTQIMGLNPSYFAASGAGKGEVNQLDTRSFPVESLTWNEAAEFCVKLSQKENLPVAYQGELGTMTRATGPGYRLPTEAEWEYSTRAGTNTVFWTGDSHREVLTAGWWSQNSTGRPHPVGELRANPFGLYDVHGNVFEFVQDGFDFEAHRKSAAPSPAVDPHGPNPPGLDRVFRGGNWRDYPYFGRSSARLGYRANERGSNIGFRVVLPVEAVKVIAPATSSTTTPNASMNDVRDAVKQLVSVPGGIAVVKTAAGVETQCTQASQIPAGDFVVTTIQFNDPADDAAVRRVLPALLNPTILKSCIAVNLHSSKLTPAILPVMAQFTTVQQFHVEQMPVGDDDLACFQNLKAVSNVWLLKGRIQGSGLKHLASCTKLNSLSLNGNPIDDAGLKNLPGTLPLHEINLSETKVGNGCVAELKRFPDLRSITLNNTAIDAAGLQELRKLFPNSRVEGSAASAAASLEDFRGEFTVVEAKYGNQNQSVDLTARMQAAAKAGRLVAFVEQELSGQKFGGELSLKLTVDGQVRDHKVAHRRFVFLDAQPAPNVPAQGLVILDAYFGTGILGEGQLVDIKDRLSQHVANNQIDVAAKQVTQGLPDPASGKSKVLIVRYALDGEIKTALFEEQARVTLGESGA